MGKEEVSELVLEDAYLVTYFRLRGFEIHPFLKDPKTVAWKVQGPRLLSILEEIYADFPVPVNTFIKTLKDVRSSIFLLRQVHGFKKS
ncbi:MAG: hypothetical protein M0Z60_03425 [Nitrospiraceae bacterium]|nr:hypothetical protein [Nitrospiraceae bacterium]